MIIATVQRPRVCEFDAIVAEKSEISDTTVAVVSRLLLQKDRFVSEKGVNNHVTTPTSLISIYSAIVAMSLSLI